MILINEQHGLVQLDGPIAAAVLKGKLLNLHRQHRGLVLVVPVCSLPFDVIIEVVDGVVPADLDLEPGSELVSTGLQGQAFGQKVPGAAITSAEMAWNRAQLIHEASVLPRSL